MLCMALGLLWPVTLSSAGFGPRGQNQEPNGKIFAVMIDIYGFEAFYLGLVSLVSIL